MRALYFIFCLVLVSCSRNVDKRLPETGNESSIITLNDYEVDTLIYKCDGLKERYILEKGVNNFDQGGWYPLMKCLVDKSFYGDKNSSYDLISIFDRLPDDVFANFISTHDYKYRGDLMYKYLLENLNRTKCIPISHGGYNADPLSSHIISKILEMSKPINGISAVEYMWELVFTDNTNFRVFENIDDECQTGLAKEYQKGLRTLIDKNKIVLKDYGEE